MTGEVIRRGANEFPKQRLKFDLGEKFEVVTNRVPSHQPNFFTLSVRMCACACVCVYVRAHMKWIAVVSPH